MIDRIVEDLAALVRETREAPIVVTRREYARLAPKLSATEKHALAVDGLTSRLNDFLHRARGRQDEPALNGETVTVQDYGLVQVAPGPDFILVRVEYQIGDTRKALIDFTVDDWLDWGGEQRAQRDAASARVEVAEYAVKVLKDHGVATAKALPADAQAALEAEASRVPTWK